MITPKPLSIGVLGPEGSHSFALAQQWLTHPDWHTWHAQCPLALTAMPSLHHMLSAFQQGTVPLLLVPIENALEGAITETLGALFQESDAPPRVLAEFRWPVRHALIQRCAGLPPPTTVVSHPQALGQCRETLLQRYGDTLERVAATSTSEAVRLLSDKPDNWAAIGTTAAAQHYGMAVIENDISDSDTNQTRFWLLAQPELALPQPPQPATHQQHTSLCIGLQDRPGVLVDTLLVFKAYGLTLTRIESRPSRRRMGDYVFFIDVAADLHHPQHDRVRMYLEADSTRLLMSSAYWVWPPFIG